MNRTQIASLAIALAACTTTPNSRVQAQSAFWSGLKPGPHAIGFRILDTVDVTRNFPSSSGKMEARPMRLYIWYPATSSPTARRVTWGEIVNETKPIHTPAVDPQGFARQIFRLLNSSEINSTDTTIANARADSMSGVPMAARWNARAAATQFPLVLLTPGSPGAFMVSAELLASHGFVVVTAAQRNHGTVESMDFTPTLANIDAEVEDLEFFLGAARTWRNVDAKRVGVMGFSTGSLSALAFTFRSRVPSAVVSLEGWEGTDAGVPIIRSYRHFDAASFRSPYLLIGKEAEDEAPFRKTSAFIDSLQSAPRWRATFDSATHGDFLGLSRTKRRVFARTNEYVLAFFRAQLNTLRSATWLPEPQESGVRVQNLTTVSANLGRDEFFRLAETNPAQAMAALRELKPRTPASAVPFAESSLNRLANLTRDRRPADALIINEIVALGYSASARAAARLSDAYWNANRRDDARIAAQRALELIDRDSAVPADQRDALRARMQTRIASQDSGLAPPHRRHHAVTYDPVSKRVLVYGGQHLVSNSEAPMLDDLWGWDGKNWNQVSTHTGIAMIAHKLFADGQGGIFARGSPRGLTTRLNGQQWSTIIEDPATQREMSAGAYDTQRHRYVLFGGHVGGRSFPRDTWEFDGRNWNQVATSGPPPMLGGMMAYDATRRVTVLFGGLDSTGRKLGDTWEWDATGWTRVSSSGPSARFGAGMAYDTALRETVLFGGMDSTNTKLNDTWRWDGKSWRLAETAAAPPVRTEGHMAYDSSRNVIVMFGGEGANVVPTLGDTWEWNGTRWTKVR